MSGQRLTVLILIDLAAVAAFFMPTARGGSGCISAPRVATTVSAAKTRRPPGQDGAPRARRAGGQAPSYPFGLQLIRASPVNKAR